jgi:hypothetical protein
MRKQDYKHHKFYYWPHHGLFYGTAIIGLTLCGVGIWRYDDQRMAWAMMAAIIVFVTGLGLMMRQHYALGNQDRTVRLELRLRYYILTGNRWEEIESKLSFDQLAALRFASDEELPSLTSEAVSANLTPDEIKKRIKNWLPDRMRV